MKHFLFVALALVCIGSAISVVVMKRGVDAQHESDAGTIADYSNQLATAQVQIAFCRGTMLTLSNRLDESRSESLTISNHLLQSESAIARAAEQITNLMQRVADAESENAILGQRVVALTNQLAVIMEQGASTGTNLDRANKDYALLENRLRRDVAERVVTERKFYNIAALETQLDRLKTYPGGDITAESIYAGLDLEVTSNGVHVIAPN